MEETIECAKAYETFADTMVKHSGRIHSEPCQDVFIIQLKRMIYNPINPLNPTKLSHRVINLDTFGWVGTPPTFWLELFSIWAWVVALATIYR